MTLKPHLATMALVALLGGCKAVEIQVPQHGAELPVAEPLDIEVTYADCPRTDTFAIHIDGVLLPSSLFTLAPGSITGMAPASYLTVGPNTITAWMPSDRAKVLSCVFRSTSDAVSIMVREPEIVLDVSPDPAVIQRGTAATVSVGITRRHFTGDVAVSPAGLPPGVVAGSIVIPAAATSGSVTLSASQAVAFGTGSYQVEAAGPQGTPTGAATADLKVSRTAGSFSEVQPTFRTAGGILRSPGNGFVAEVNLSNNLTQEYSVFFRTAGGQRLSDARFFVGPTSSLGGVGFCAGDSTAVVLSGRADTELARASDHLFTLFYFPDAPTADNVEVHRSYRQVNATVEPRVFLSPDCTLAAVAGLDPNSPPSTGRKSVVVWDLLGHARLSSPATFPIAASIAATVVVSGSSTVVRVTGGGQSVDFTVP